MSLNLQQKIATIQEAKDDIKTAIINKGVVPSGNITTYANAINQIDTVNNQSKTATQNGTVYFDEGYTGLSQVTVSVNQSVENKNITENGTYTADTGYIGLGTVAVNVNPIRISKTITDNGVYLADDEDAYGYRQVTVNVPKGLPREIKNGVFQTPSEPYTFSLPSNATDLGDYALSSAFIQDNKITILDLSSLTTISGQRALDSVCYNNTTLTSVNFSNLVTISGNSVFYNAFAYCSFSPISFPSLTTISGTTPFLRAFALNSDTEVYFPALTSAGLGNDKIFKDMFFSSAYCIVHFPSNLQSIISNWSDARIGFNGGHTMIFFDLEATE